MICPTKKDIFVHHYKERRYKPVTENEKELIKLIRENDSPEQALMTAAVIILGYLKQHESFESQVSAYLQELG